MDYKLELVLLPVADVDRAKAFYLDQLKFELIVDHRPNENFRIVQVNPPGSACSVGFGVGVQPAGGAPVKGLHLVVPDIVGARDELRARDVDVTEVRHVGMDGVWSDGPHPDRSDYNSFAEFEDLDGNLWLLQERGYTG